MILDASAITKKTNGCGHQVTEENCTCMYFSAMQIPCRHIFQFLFTKNLELFKPNLCAERWTKSYYYKSHPAISGLECVAPGQPIHVTKVRVPEEKEKFKRTATLTKDLNNLLSNMSNSEFEYYYSIIGNVRSGILNRMNTFREEENPTSSAPLISYRGNDVSCSNLISPIDDSSILIEDTQNDGTQIKQILSERSHRLNDETHLRNGNIYQRITLPSKIVPVGRPKGTHNTAVGIKRKNPQTSKQNWTPAKKKKFIERDVLEQGVVVTSWLTNWPKNRIGNKKVTMGDIIQDPHTFNRLRYDQLDLNCIKKHLDKNAFRYIVDEVERLKEKPYTCRKCQKNLMGLQIMCHSCLDWYHGKCINVSASAAKNLTYFCSDC